MSVYKNDRQFTDFVHTNIALSKIYEPLGWKPVSIEKDKAEYLDMYLGVDYVFEVDHVRRTVQERFRERKYSSYSDFTIRYRRDQNPHSQRRESEYYKLAADYFVYGISNCLKTDIEKCTDFLKFAVIDLSKVYDKLNSGQIVIQDNGQNSCRIESRQLVCPIKYNKDGSSSFFPIDIPLIVELWQKELVVKQHGFF